MEAIILAGGFGIRLRSVCSDRPKPMAPIQGKPFLEYLLEYWKGQGVSHFILSVGYLHRVIIDYFGKEYQGIPIDYAIEDEPLGTGGGLLQSIPYLQQSPFLLLNGDTFFNVPLGAFSATFINSSGVRPAAALPDRYCSATKRSPGPFCSIPQSSAIAPSAMASSCGPLRFDPALPRSSEPCDEFMKMAAFSHRGEVALALYKIEKNTRYYGVTLNESSKIQNYNNPDSQLINGGCYLFKREALAGFRQKGPLSLENEILPRLNCYGQLFDGLFIDIGIPEDYERSQALFPNSSRFERIGFLTGHQMLNRGSFQV